jgi:subtilisin family serine protease
MKFAAGVISALLICSVASAGTVDPDLANKIEKADSDQMFRTLIYMADQVDVFAMKDYHNRISATRAQRHYEVVTALQDMATKTQADLLSYLTDAQSRGTVGDFQGFWIANMIAAEMNSTEIQAVASRGDVEAVYSDFEAELIKPIIDDDYEPPVISSVEQGLRAVRADSMWMLGITGQGRLVCNIDTGVDGNHPALNHSWRGSNGYSPEESWIDTADPDDSHFPYDQHGHGTHTMGTICGRSITTDDTVGVAIDAQWIAARAIDVSGGNAFLAFQWAADPDGDPNTVEDVPDVISNSWGGVGGCPTGYYTVIDNCEAAGAAVVFAAGNEGPGAQTLRWPANRVTTPYNCFSVGAVNGHYDSYPIANFSSRGPSQCDGRTIKPEVVAPGVNVRSSVPGGGYQSNWSGTSMACPHVAGAIALLRQVNPNASVDTIKWALMESAQDLGSEGEDNTYGYGMINILHAMDLIPQVEAPYVFPNAAYVSEPNDDYPDPGETIELTIRLANSGLDVDNVYAIISTDDEYTEVTSDSAFYGYIAQDDTALSSPPYAMSFSEETPPGRTVAFDLLIVGDDGYSVTRSVSLMVGRLSPEIANHDAGSVLFTISNFGQYGLAPDGMNGAWDGEGFKMPQAGVNYLFEGALFIGDGPTRVSNGARDESEIVSDHFVPMDSITLAEPGPFADQEYYTAFNDQNAPEPLGVMVNQKTFAFADAPDDDYVISEYTITNVGDEDLDGVLVAHFEDWDMTWGVGNDRVNFDRERNLGYEYNSSNYRGQAVLSDPGVFSFMALDNEQHVYPPHFTMADKWSYMNAGTVDTAITSQIDCSIIITTGPFDIPRGDSVVAAFAILGGTSLADIQDNASAAIARYAGMTAVDDGEIERPGDFFLSQNYPNPFNAQTQIEFALPGNGHVRLEAYDLLGRRVAILVDDRLGSGLHSITWDCTDLSTGVYFYRLSFEDRSVVRKMTLIK